ncbi:TraB/GumN family protein [Sphingorhabdus pulchriflava]|uniref:TraB/GumN family protein n=1 Tax=Sphingorhabdus pulchriflava TaxID=2292257 RepID=A0A371BF49_9SPHN|nr:TraB/GumN family protein [Sphingorhabdus pulchriflava]RDV06204.1 TraB/GumN family protein [Sphingorhabdus pulchriflava]
MKSLLLNSALLAITLSLSAIGGPTASPALAAETPPAAPAAVETVDVDPALWVVKDADTTIYMFGTVHILKPGMGWFDEAVKEAFDKSDRLVLEMVEPGAGEAQQLFAKYGLDKSGKPLTSKMTEEEKAIYTKAMEKVGLPAAAFEPFDPWAAAVTMQVMGLQKGGYDTNSGVETQLTAAAKASKKPISGVETMESQLAIFDSLSQETQVKFLIEAAKVVDDMTTSMDAMVALWAKPDPDGLAKVMNDGLTDPKLYAALLTNRNANWAAWINKQMEKPGTIFMAVGAGHLSGTTSVPKLLTAYGIETERVAY